MYTRGQNIYDKKINILVTFTHECVRYFLKFHISYSIAISNSFCTIIILIITRVMVIKI
jgi:hypothetical protein